MCEWSRSGEANREGGMEGEAGIGIVVNHTRVVALIEPYELQ